jgi:DUF4097 and DUF4098 domain-containing protein YvlB
MRRPLAVLTVLTVLTVPLLAAQQKINRRIPIDGDASIRIYNLFGATRVVGWDRDSIAVTGSAATGSTFFMGGAGRAAKLGLERDDGSTATAVGSLDVWVPRGARVWIKSAAGAIEVSGMSGEVDLASVSGSIRVAGSLRIITAESIDGDIEVLGPSPLVRVKTGGGKILLRQSGGDVTASTVSGPIIATEAQPMSARLETVSGAVSYLGSIDRRGTLNVQTHSGNVELRLPPTIGAEFDLQSLDGAVVVDLPNKAGKPLKGKTLFFANGGGGAQVIVRSFKGEIRISGQ